jgi:hypothetical protein
VGILRNRYYILLLQTAIIPNFLQNKKNPPKKANEVCVNEPAEITAENTGRQPASVI